MVVTVIYKNGVTKTVQGSERKVRGFLTKHEGWIIPSSITWSDRLPWE